MCFSIVQSSLLAGVAFINAVFAYQITKDWKIPVVVGYFCAMELLQVFQYMVIDQCDNPINKFLTILAYLHVSFQPCMPAIAFWGFSRNLKVQQNLRFLTIIAVFASIFLFMRMPLAYVPFFNEGNSFIASENLSSKYAGFQHGYDKDGSLLGSKTVCGRPFEMMRGNEICTFTGRRHLAWSVKMAENSYWIASVSIHFFFFYGPFLFINHDLIPYWGQLLVGLMFFVTGPFYAAIVTNDPMEQPAIWCFYSVLQVILVQGCFLALMGKNALSILRKPAAKKEN